MGICRETEEVCCFRDRFTCQCNILRDTDFDDGMCHFRKETFTGPNEYDLMKHGNKNRYIIECAKCRTRVFKYPELKYCPNCGRKYEYNETGKNKYGEWLAC